MVRFPDGLPDTCMVPGKEGGRALWLLQKQYRVVINGYDFVMRAGIVFDYASVPRLFWPVVPPCEPETAPAALLHDVAYGGELWPRKVCDMLLLGGLRACNVPAWKRAIMTAAVRIGGARPYRHTEEKRMAVRKILGLGNETNTPLWKTLDEAWGE